MSKLAALGLLVAVAGCTPTPSATQRGGMVAEPRAARVWSCPKRLTVADVSGAITLGTSFMLNSQLPEGRFAYEYDWRTKRDSEDDNPVRQAGAAWGLSLLLARGRSARLERATFDALGFFGRHARQADGKRWVAYPGVSPGTLGTVALTALANLETYSALDEADERRGPLLDTLEGYVRFVLAARAEDGRFHSRYDVDSGESHGPPSPYFDGESLLLLVHAAKRLDRSDLRAAALQAAEAGYQLNVREALDDDPDSSVTKGYYQWSSMAYYALAESGWPDTERYGGRLLELADWMIDVHRTLARERNTAYAYEGIVPAYAWANAHGDARSAKLGCVIEQGLSKLLSWQVGSPLANAFIAEQPTYDPRAIGGVQNHKSEPGLRIDVAQHQLHALMLARELYLAR